MTLGEWAGFVSKCPIEYRSIALGYLFFSGAILFLCGWWAGSKGRE